MFLNFFDDLFSLLGPQPPSSNRGSHHRFSDSMTSSTSSSGLGTDVHSLRHSLPSPVMETVAPSAATTSSVSSQSLLVSETNNKGHEAKGQLTKQQSRKVKAKETSPQAVSTSSKAKRSSSKKKKNSSSTTAGGSVLDQVRLQKWHIFLVWQLENHISRRENGKREIRYREISCRK